MISHLRRKAKGGRRKAEFPISPLSLLLYSFLLLTALLAGSFDATLGIGGAAPFGNLEFNHSAGIAGSVVLGCNRGPSRLEFTSDLIRLPGNQQPDYFMSDYRIGLAYHYALVNKLDWKLRAGAGVDLNNLTRQLGSASERGSVLGPTIALTYVRSFGHPQFSFQLFGSELLEFAPAGGGSSVTPATLVGFKIGAGYEF